MPIESSDTAISIIAQNGIEVIEGSHCKTTYDFYFQYINENRDKEDITVITQDYRLARLIIRMNESPLGFNRVQVKRLCFDALENFDFSRELLSPISQRSMDARNKIAMAIDELLK